MLDINEHKSLSELVYEELKAAIVTCRIKPGERLMELELADQMGVSRTPVREAIRQLEKDNLISIIPRRGAYVSEISLKDIVKIAVVREPLEGIAVYLAMQSITDKQMAEIKAAKEKCEELYGIGEFDGLADADLQFHNAIVAASGNEYLISILHKLQEHSQRFRTLFFRSIEKARAVIEEHRLIYECIVNEDVDGAKERMLEHIQNIRKMITDDREFNKQEMNNDKR